MKLTLRRVNLSDLPSILTLFTETIHAVCTNDYTLEQRKVWASGAKDLERWKQKIAHQHFLVAEHDNLIVGFGSMENGSHIDLLYTHKDFQGKGIAGLLLNAMENEARKSDSQLISADVSRTAKRFFEKTGFYIVREQTKVINAVAIGNYRMKKKLLHGD